MSSKKMVTCKWCGKVVERKDAEFWGTGALVCKECYQKEMDIFNEMIEEVRREGRKGLETWFDD